MIKRLRKILGPIKCLVFDQWPYRREIKRIPRLREQARQALRLLPQIKTETKSGNPIEVHMLCGERDLDMGIWASWSLFRFLDGRGRLYVHSDGSLNEGALEAWRAVIEGVVIVEKKESEARAHQLLAKSCPLLHDWGLNHWASSQLIDMHLAGRAESLLIMDSDVLCFSRPTAVLESMESKDFAWSKDLINAYSGPLDLIQELAGVEMPRRLCAGFLAAPRLTIGDFSRLEEKLEVIHADGRLETNHFWSCQTYYAILVALKGGGTILPAQYSNRMRSGTRDQVIRHYVGIPCVRFRYFKEGLKRILAELDFNISSSSTNDGNI